MQAIPYIMMFASAAISADQQKRAGEIQQQQTVIDSNAEGDAAREREIQRKKLLQRALSSQLAQAGAMGVKFSEGSPKRIAQLDTEDARRDLAIDTATTKQRRRALRLKGIAAEESGRARAATTLLDTAARATG